MKLILLLSLSINLMWLGKGSLSIDEGRVLHECLTSFGGLSAENVQRLARFKHWSDNYEEFPCFTNCYLNKMLNIYNEAEGFNENNIIAKYGQPAYETCQLSLTQAEDNCELAYRGFRCLIKLETDPLFFIDSISRISAEAKTVLKDCLQRFPQADWFNSLVRYRQYPTQEPIPCYTRCFVDKLQLFSYRFRKWNIDALQSKLGVPKANATYDNCFSLTKYRTNNICRWIYTELTCFNMAV